MTRRRTRWCADRSLEVLRAEGPHHTPVQQSLNHLGLQNTDFQSGEVVLSYNFGPKRLKHAHMRRISRPISNERSALSWMTPPRYLVCLSIPLAGCFDGERRSQGRLARYS